MNQQALAWNAQWHEEEAPEVDERPADFMRPSAAKVKNIQMLLKASPKLEDPRRFWAWKRVLQAKLNEYSLTGYDAICALWAAVGEETQSMIIRTDARFLAYSRAADERTMWALIRRSVGGPSQREGAVLEFTEARQKRCETEMSFGVRLVNLCLLYTSPSPRD